MSRDIHIYLSLLKNRNYDKSHQIRMNAMFIFIALYLIND